MTSDRIVVIGLDGARGEALREAATPNIDALVTEGAVTYAARTVMPSISFPAWGSMFHGVGPEKHQLSPETPCTEDDPWPSFFKAARQQRPGLTCASFSCWNMINKHMIEDSCDCRFASMPDEQLVDLAVPYIQRHMPDMLFVQLDFIDHAGHAHGYQTPEYLEQITKTDRHVGQLVNALRSAGLFETTLLVVLSDHGGVEKMHGSDDPDCMNIFWACRGHGIAMGVELDSDLNIMDTAAVVMRALGLDAPEGWDAKVPEGLFTA